MLQATPTRGARTTWVDALYEDKQRRKLFIAIVLLLTAITAVLLRDREALFGNDNDNDVTVAASTEQPAYSPSTAGPPPALPAAEAKPPVAPKPLASTSNRAHAIARVAVTSVKRESRRDRGAVVAAPSATWASATPAMQRTSTSTQAETHQQAPSYPLLTGAMAIQGSVLLQALIAADGAVEEMRVISGPTILVSAARQAVQQWRFKPYLVNGKAVETYARVTVKFAIDVSNTEARYHVTSVTSSGAL